MARKKRATPRKKRATTKKKLAAAKRKRVTAKKTPETRSPEVVAREELSKDFVERVRELYSSKDISSTSPDLDELKKKLDTLRALWLRVPGVTGLDVGYKVKEGTVLREKPLTLRLHVTKKLEGKKREELPDWQEFLPEKRFGDIGDVIEANYQAQPFIGTMDAENANLKDRLDPLVGGASVGNQWSANTGTLGLVVWDKTDGRPCILSNWHVLARGKWMLPGSPIYQPGPYDGAMVQDRVAILKRWRFDERMDAALAELTGDRSYAAGTIWGQKPVGCERELTGIRPGDRLVKSGRTTCRTRGVVEGFWGTYLVGYAGGPRLLTDQIRIVPDPNEGGENDSSTCPVSQPGDSGAVWLFESEDQPSCMATALHFAGDASGLGRFALATPMATVADELEFSVTPRFLMSQEDLEAMNFIAFRARAVSQPVGDPIGGGASQPVGDPIGGGGAQPVGDPIGGGGAQPVGDPIGGGGAQPVGDPIGG